MKFFKQAEDLYEKAINGTIDRNDLTVVTMWPDEQISTLFACADQVRRKFKGDMVDPCSLMNVKSGGCSEDCSFCSQSAHNDTSVSVRDLASIDEIRNRCEKAQKEGLPLCVVSSGRRLSLMEVQQIAEALSGCICEKHASLGILDDQQFGLLREAGVMCYNHNLETSRSFFPKIVTTHTYDERVATVKSAKQAGFKVCCGGIFGLGETWNDRIDFCFELRDLDIDTIPLNFLIAIEGTRTSQPQESALDFLKIISMFRLAMPDKTIKVCGGREDHLGSLQSLIFYAGANGYVTGGYLTTPGEGIEADNKMISLLGLKKMERNHDQ